MRIMWCVLIVLLPLSLRAQYVGGDTTASRPADGQPYAPARVSAPVDEQRREGLGEPWYTRLSPGGNFSASFGTYTYVEASPYVLYRLTDRLLAGPGLTYIYYSYNYGSNIGKVSTSVYGGRFFGRYLLLDNLFLQAEYEGLNIPYVQTNPVTQISERTRTWIYNPLVGGGLRLPFDRTGSGLYLTALYNLNYQSGKSIYPSPLIIRVGASF